MIIQQLLPQHVTLIVLNTVKLKQRYEENEKLLKIAGEKRYDMQMEDRRIPQALANFLRDIFSSLKQRA